MPEETITGSDIDLDSIKSLRNKLKAYSIRWCSDMAEKMFGITEKTTFKNRERAKGRVNNVVFGQARNPEMKAIFMIKGAELLREYEERQAALGAAVETAKSV